MIWNGWAFALVIAPVFAWGQAREPGTEPKAGRSPVDIGMGVGLDYGGLGVQLSARTSQRLTLFGSAGYAVVGLGYNVGGKLTVNPFGRTRVNFGAMYGYNAVIQVDHASQYNKMYYGPSGLVGFEFPVRRKKKNYFSLEVIVPFRSRQFRHDIHTLHHTQGIDISEPLPVTFSVGYHIGL